MKESVWTVKSRNQTCCFAVDGDKLYAFAADGVLVAQAVLAVQIVSWSPLPYGNILVISWQNYPNSETTSG